MESSNSVNSVNRVFRIIEALSSYPNGCSLSLLVEETRLKKSTIHRFLKTLEILGYVTAATVQGSYRLTFKIANVGQKLIHETNVVQLALPELTQLRNATKETVNLKHFHQDHDVIVFKLEPKSGNFRTRSYIGHASPLYCTATGKVFLACRGKQFIKEYWKRHQASFKKVTNATIVDLDEFIERCEEAQKKGYAFDHEENELGISCIAAPVIDINGEVNYAISISLQTAKLNAAKIEQYSKPLLESAKRLSKELGHNGGEK